MLNFRLRTPIVRRSRLSLPIAGLLGAALILAETPDRVDVVVTGAI